MFRKILFICVLVALTQFGCFVADDADLDPISDSVDNSVEIPNDGQSDSDGDDCENCPAEYNPGQEDADSNGTGDEDDESEVIADESNSVFQELLVYILDKYQTP